MCHSRVQTLALLYCWFKERVKSQLTIPRHWAEIPGLFCPSVLYHIVRRSTLPALCIDIVWQNSQELQNSQEKQKILTWQQSPALPCLSICRKLFFGIPTEISNKNLKNTPFCGLFLFHTDLFVRSLIFCLNWDYVRLENVSLRIRLRYTRP